MNAMYPLSTLNLNKVTPYAVGFDRIFNQMLKHLENQTNSTGFPPYNITQVENSYYIDMALAGVDKKDVSIELEGNDLTITYAPPNEEHQESVNWLFKGIASRGFTRRFTLADNIIVKNAKMHNGVLQIQLERLIPDYKKPKQIAIS
jgi:molecular chaperone IbpA